MRRFYPSAFSLLVLSGAMLAQDPNKPIAASANASAQPSTTTDNSIIDENPVTVKTAKGNEKKDSGDTDPLFGVPPLPPGKTSLIGGTVAGIDGVHNRLSVSIFGKGGKWNVAFDERTHFFVDGAETTFEKVEKGERVYVDTMLDGHQIFARNVHIVTKTGPVGARGQVAEFNNGVLIVNDDLSTRPVQFRVEDQTQVKRNGNPASINDLQPGSIITVQFSPASEGHRVAREIAILAAPGQSATFAGTVRHLDLRNHKLSIENQSDNKTYDIAFSGEKSIPSDLMVGSDVRISAAFDGRQYKANSITVQKQSASKE